MLNFKIIGDNELKIYLKNVEGNLKKEVRSGLKDISVHLQREVKDKFGKYQASWPKLKRASVIAKYNRRSLNGFKRPKLNNKSQVILGGDDPLVLMGDLHDSIRRESNTREAVVFSDNEYAAVHEYGYAPKGVPSRSYMRLTLMEEEDAVLRLLSEKIKRAL